MAGVLHKYLIPIGIKLPVTVDEGVNVNLEPLQIAVVVLATLGFGFTVTVMAKELPIHEDVLGVTVYTRL